MLKRRIVRISSFVEGRMEHRDICFNSEEQYCEWSNIKDLDESNKFIKDNDLEMNNE